MGQYQESATGTMVPAGTHELVWDGVDLNGRHLPSGTYLLKMSAGDFTATQRMTLVK